MTRVDEALALVADIGGTHARFALSRRGAPTSIEHDSVRALAVAAFPSLGDAVREYLRDIHARPARAVLAVAGPIVDDTIRLTNAPWTFSRAGLCADLGLAEVRVVNDFAAMSAGIPELPAAALRVIGSPPARSLADEASRVVTILGPGTGLGVGLLLRRDGRSLVIDTEGGHAAFAPVDDLEVEIRRRLLLRYGRVSNERLVSGPGLLDLYCALCEVEGTAPTAERPESVTVGALAGQADCIRAVERFVAILGSVAGDAALVSGARDGVFLAGGLVAPLLPWLEAGGFRRRFEDKGRVSAAVIGVPTVAVLHQHAGLLGAGALASTGRVTLMRAGI